jgi:cardiolipin synthase
MLTVASYITLIRLFLSPVVVYFIQKQQWSIAAIIFLFAAATDLIDGFIARRFNQQSDLGQILDPLADKCLIMATLYSLLFYVQIVPIAGAQFIPYFLLAKECILLTVGGFLKLRYNFFIKPSKLSRAASIGEILLIITFFTKVISDGYVVGSFDVAAWLPLIEVTLLYSNLLLSVWLLTRYAYTIDLF